MKKRYLLTLLLSLVNVVVFAQSNFFRPAENSDLTNTSKTVNITKKTKVFTLDEQSMRNYLKNAPMEFKNNGVTVPLQIPMPDGTIEVFNMVESPVLSPEIAAQNPDIKTYTGNGTTDRKSVIRLSLTAAGFNAVILNVGNDAVYFESYSTTKKNVYFNYYAKDIVVPDEKKSSSCHIDANTAKEFRALTNKTSRSAVAPSSGDQLLTLRLAMPADAEFVAANGGTVTSGFAAVVAYVNRIKGFFRNELSVDFLLVSGTNMIYTDAATDPYTNSNQSLMLIENHNNCNTVIGSANYDIGHVWGKGSSSGGGVAILGSVGQSGSKGQGVSGEGDLTSYSQVFMDQLVFHEMGHQFGMNHSYNSSIPVCTTRNAGTSVEPGAGATVMSYGFTCDGDDYFSSNQTGPILQFHSVSYDEAKGYLATIPGVGTLTTTGNTAPVITMPNAYTIPKSTPFALTATATDANNDALTYCWEGTNVGTMVPVTSTLADTAQPPFFRSYKPSTSNTRYFPLLEKILDGSNYAVGDKLPSIGVVTTHSLTVRDNNANGGGVSNASVTVTVDGNIGPFLETTNLSGAYNGLSKQNITWSVNGTNVATPTVNILLSTDGGLTFPTVLVAGTPNDGIQEVTFPDVLTQKARIKVEGAANIFFDISNVNFTLKPSLAISVTGTDATTFGGADGSATAAIVNGSPNFTYGDKSVFTNAPYSIGEPATSTPEVVSTITVPALPAGAVLTSATLTLTNVNAVGGSFRKEIRASLSGAYTLGDTQLFTDSGSGLISPDPVINLSGFPTTGGVVSLLLVDLVDDAGVDATVGGAFITLNYTKSGYTYSWSNGATTASINGLAAGQYNVTVTDAANSVATGSYLVKQPYSITATSGTNGSVTPAGVSSVASGT
ncbi:reprolysin-like metallopeptidase, partial [Flavobacterium muglaense]